MHGAFPFLLLFVAQTDMILFLEKAVYQFNLFQDSISKQDVEAF